MKKALFLDRDGIINHDPGDYTRSWADFHFLPGIERFLKKKQEEGYLLILITNQGGVAKGLYSLETVEEIHLKMKEHFKTFGIEIEEIYYSPYHDDYSKSLSRKPGSILIEKALARFNLEPSACFMIGDKDRDVACAENAGVRGYKVPVNADLNKVFEHD